MAKGICCQCKEEFDTSKLYEHRGAIACEGCFDSVCQSREHKRQEIIEDCKHRTDCFKGLDMSDSVIGKANKAILKPQIEIAKKESGRRKDYEQSRRSL